MRSAFVLLVAGVTLAAAAPAHAQEPVVADGVTIAGVDVAGLTRDEARAEMHAFFDRRLRIDLRGRTLSVAPRTAGGRARVNRVVKLALASPEDAALPLEVVVYQGKLKRWRDGVAARFNRPARDASLKLRNGRPYVRPARPGRKIVRRWSRRVLTRALKAHRREGITMPARNVAPTVTRRDIGPAVVIRRGSKRLTLYRGGKSNYLKARASFGVATGQAAYPTPLGRFHIVTKQRHPWWYPPSAGWAAGAEPIPPGPGNPLGTRWMGLSVGAVGIHGTPDASSIGYSASHGCIRMRIPEAEWLFERVRVGTTVFIIGS